MIYVVPVLWEETQEFVEDLKISGKVTRGDGRLHHDFKRSSAFLLSVWVVSWFRQHSLMSQSEQGHSCNDLVDCPHKPLTPRVTWFPCSL
jgi:hypothetical protein